MILMLFGLLTLLPFYCSSPVADYSALRKIAGFLSATLFSKCLGNIKDDKCDLVNFMLL
jgi:hypothetical protein